MTTIFLINNSLTMNVSLPDSETLESRREKRILSIDGEKESKNLSKSNLLKNVNVIYSSPFVMSIGTAKYLANTLDLDIIVSPEIGERKVGALGGKKISVLTEMQENDFDYKLYSGESLNDVKKRMLSFLNMLLKKYEDKDIAVFTHNVAITSLLSEYCNKGYNLDNRLILNYNEEAIIDGAWNGLDIIELKFNNKDLVSITRKK